MTEQRIRPPWWLKPLNRVYMAMLKLGLPVSGKEGPVVLTVTGRNSGQPRSTPITPMYIDGERYVVGGFPGADWVRNAQADPHATLTQGRRTERVTMVEIPAEQARPRSPHLGLLAPAAPHPPRHVVDESALRRIHAPCWLFKFDRPHTNLGFALEYCVFVNCGGVRGDGTRWLGVCRGRG